MATVQHGDGVAAAAADDDVGSVDRPRARGAMVGAGPAIRCREGQLPGMPILADFPVPPYPVCGGGGGVGVVWQDKKRV